MASRKASTNSDSILVQGIACITVSSEIPRSCCLAVVISVLRTETSEKPGDTGESLRKTMPTRDYKESLFADLRDPEFAVAYLNAALEEGTHEVFLLHLRDVADAWGGV